MAKDMSYVGQDALPLTRDDATVLADLLLDRFGDLGRVLSAERDDLLGVPGMGEAAADRLGLVREAALSLIEAKARNRNLIGSFHTLVEYLTSHIGHGETEALFVLLLDRKNRLIKKIELARGTVDHVPVYPREIARLAIKHDASAVIIAHNHPSGDPEPSTADIDMTKKVKKAIAAIGVTLHDHVVIGHGGANCSLRAAGMM